jgi:hypothetical protein
MCFIQGQSGERVRIPVMVSSTKTMANAFSFQTGAASSGVVSLLVPEVFGLCGGMLKGFYTRVQGVEGRCVAGQPMKDEEIPACCVGIPYVISESFYRVTYAIFFGYRMDLQDVHN